MTNTFHSFFQTLADYRSTADIPIRDFQNPFSVRSEQCFPMSSFFSHPSQLSDFSESRGSTIRLENFQKHLVGIKSSCKAVGLSLGTALSIFGPNYSIVMFVNLSRLNIILFNKGNGRKLEEIRL